MPRFRYKALAADGRQLRGVVDADSTGDAQHRLSGRGWRSLEILPCVLPRTGEAFVVRRRSRWPLVVTLLLVLGAAVAALLWSDPWGWLAALRR